MPVTDNDICCALAQSARSPDTYRGAVLSFLYEAATGGGGGGGSEGMTISAGGSSAFLSSLVFSNSNNISFGLNGSTITGSVVPAEVKDIVIGGNTSGTTAVINSGTMTLAGGNNVTLSQVGNAVTISAASQSLQTQSIIRDVNIVGNTSGVTADITSGTMTLAGGNNVTLSQAGNAITISAASQSVQTQGLFDAQIGGNTSGTTALISSGTMTLVGGNNVTLSQVGNAVTISGASQSLQTQSIVRDVVVSGNTSGTTANITSGTMTLAGGNNITLSQVGNVITISAASQSVQTQNLLDAQIAGNTSGTTALISSGTMTLAGGNNVTLSQAGNAVTISAASQSVQTQNLIDLQIGGNTSGTTALVSSGTLTLAGGNNITLSQVGNAITISGGGAAAGTTFSQTIFNSVGLSATKGAGSLTSLAASRFYLFPLNELVSPVSMSMVRMLGNFSLISNTNATVTISGATTFNLAFYTLNGSSLSLASSTSVAFSYSDVLGANFSLYGNGGADQIRYDIPFNVLLNPATQVFGGLSFSCAGTVGGQSFNYVSANGSLVVPWGSASNTSFKMAFPFHGRFSTTTNAFPSSIGTGDILNSNSSPIYFAPTLICLNFS